MVVSSQGGGESAMLGGIFLVLVAVVPVDSVPVLCSFGLAGKIRLIGVIFGETSEGNSATLIFDLSSITPCTAV